MAPDPHPVPEAWPWVCFAPSRANVALSTAPTANRDAASTRTFEKNDLFFVESNFDIMLYLKVKLYLLVLGIGHTHERIPGNERMFWGISHRATCKPSRISGLQLLQPLVPLA
jgi:hypothetical protein